MAFELYIVLDASIDTSIPASTPLALMNSRGIFRLHLVTPWGRVTGTALPADPTQGPENYISIHSTRRSNPIETGTACSGCVQDRSSRASLDSLDLLPIQINIHSVMLWLGELSGSHRPTDLQKEKRLIRGSTSRLLEGLSNGDYSCMMPLFAPSVTASVRPLTPSLLKIWMMWVFTVLSPMNN